MTIRRTLTVALAAAALAAPAASALPADMPVSAGQASAPHEPRQDLRGERARDAAIHLPEDAPLMHSRLAPFSGPASPGHPSEAGNTVPLAPASDKPLASSDDSVDWATLGLGVAGLVLFMGGVVALATRTRPTAGPRVSV